MSIVDIKCSVVEVLGVTRGSCGQQLPVTSTHAQLGHFLKHFAPITQVLNAEYFYVNVYSQCYCNHISKQN